MHINPLLHGLFLDHDIIFYFWTTLKIFNKNLVKVLITFENIMENGAFASLVFHNIFKCMILQRHYYGVKAGVQWLSGRVLVSKPRGCGLKPHQHHYVVSLSKTH